MFDAEAMTERHALILTELAGIGMAIARELQAQVLEAETPEARAKAAASFPQVARAVRQSLALEARLRRDLVRDVREMQRDAERELDRRLRRRKTRVRMFMQRAICNACPDRDAPDDEALARLEDLRDRLDDDLLEPDFADMPFPEAIALLHRALGMDPPDFGPEPLDDDPGDDPDGEPDDPEAHDPAPPEAAPEPEPYFRYSSA